MRNHTEAGHRVRVRLAPVFDPVEVSIHPLVQKALQQYSTARRPRRPAVTERAGRIALWVGLLLPGLAPWLCPFPPFQDWPAHVGVVGALAQIDDPAARLGSFYEYTGWFKLNMLFYLPAWGLTTVVDPISAANVCLAVAVASLGPASWLLCRSLNADPRLALVATPLALGRHVYCGFGPNAAALPLFVVALAAYFFVRAGRRTAASAALLIASMLALAWTHAFVYLAGFGLLLLVALGDVLARPRRAAAAAFLSLGLSFVLFAVLVRQGLGVYSPVPSPSFGQTLEAVGQAVVHAPRDRLPQTFWTWLFASYRYRKFDDLLQIGWAVGLVGGLLMTWSLEGVRWWRTGRAALLGLAVWTGLVFVVLPENVGPPVNWWGARLRLPALVALLLIPMLSARVGRQLGAFVPAFATLSVGAVVAGLFDLAAFHQRYTADLREVLDAVPRGQRVSMLHFTPRSVHEYPGEPFGYFGNFYLARRGGAVPQDFFERRELPFRRRARLPAPSWGMAEVFHWPRHGPGFDGFLLKTDAAKGHAPFHRHRSQVELVKATANWRYYRVRGSP